MSEITEAEVAFNLTFSDKALLQRALTHRSYLNENPDYPLEDNERLEFLGDAILDFITGEYLVAPVTGEEAINTDISRELSAEICWYSR